MPEKRYVVEDVTGGVISKPAPLDAALHTYQAWDRQGGLCQLYELVPLDVEVKLTVKKK